MRTGILGAGLAGLTLGRRLHEAGCDVVLFEREPDVGGLCRTIRHGDYAWDLGVHALYSAIPGAMDYFHALPLQYDNHARNVKICHWGQDGKIYELEYPFENGISNLPIEERVDCLEGYAQCGALNRKSFGNLRDWIDNRLGYGIARSFMNPYNEKIWSCDLNEISMDLVNNKIDPAPLRTIIKSCLGERSVGRSYQARFIYPRGGISRVPEAIAATFADKIHLGAEVTGLVREHRKWRIISRGVATETVDRVVSTMPLKELLKILNTPEAMAWGHDLRHNDTRFFMIGLAEGREFQRFGKCHWVFFAGPEAFYRITIMNNFDSSMAPSLVAEITVKTNAVSGDDNARRRVVNDLVNAGVIGSPTDVALHKTFSVKYTYPIPTVGLPQVKERIASRLRKEEIHLFGRSGAWEYINMDGVVTAVECFIAGLDW